MEPVDLERSSSVASGTPRILRDNESPIWVEGKPWSMDNIGLSIPVLALLDPDGWPDPKIKLLIMDARKIDDIRRERGGLPSVEEAIAKATT